MCECFPSQSFTKQGYLVEDLGSSNAKKWLNRLNFCWSFYGWRSLYWKIMTAWGVFIGMKDSLFFIKKTRKRRCTEAALCRFFAAVSATVTEISRCLQLEKKKNKKQETPVNMNMWPKNVPINFWFSPNAKGRQQVLAQQRKWGRNTLLASLTWSWNFERS